MFPVIKDFYALNLTDSQLTKLIAKLEDDVTEQLLSLQDQKGPLDEVTQQYHVLKQEYDKVTSELEDNKSLLEALIRYKENPKGAKEIRVLRSTSVNDIEDKGKRNFKWVIWSTVILEKQQRFMTPDALFAAILKMKPEIAQSVGGDEMKLNRFKKVMIYNFQRTIADAREKRRGRIIDYQSKIGLFEWVDTQFRPRPQFLKEFMMERKEAVL